MPPDRWEKIQRIFRAALEKPEDQRLGYVEAECAGDSELFGEVLSLVGHADDEGDFTAAVEEIADAPRIRPGRKLGHYEVEAPIGAGGMGQVFRAHDDRLDREVALKVLHTGSNRQHRERLLREARSAAALNHPNIVAVHDIGTSEEIDYVAMEYVRGRTLAQIISQGPIEEATMLDYARQLAEALDAAHSAGVIHRDLKPGNVIVADSGALKVLDFGLAKRVSSTDQSLTKPGVILGTVAYMSPEQALAKPVDERSDIFSFGSVCYEMVSGKKPFAQETDSGTLAAIITQEPAPLEGVSEPTAQLIRKCLAKAPDDRFQTASELHQSLRALAKRVTRLSIAPVRREGRRRFAALATAGAALTLAVAWLALGPSGEPQIDRPVRRFTFQHPGSANGPRVSPDGSRISYIGYRGGEPQVWFHDLAEARSVRAPSTTGPSTPFWSPDSQSIGYVADGELRVLPVDGGTPRTVCKLPGPGFRTTGCWTPDSASILFSTVGPIRTYRVAASGGEPVAVPHTEESAEMRVPAVAQILTGASGEEIGLIVTGPVGAYQVELMEMASGRRVVLAENARHPFYASSGHVLYETMDRDLWAVPVSIEEMRAAGQPVRLEEQAGAPSVGEDGTLVYESYPGRGQHQLAWYNRQGVRSQLIGEPQTQIRVPSISPRGDRVAVSGLEGGIWRIWLHDVDRSVHTRFTDSESAWETQLLWSPDGRRGVFARNSAGSFDLHETAIERVSPEPLHLSPVNELPSDWSDDGRRILYYENNAETKQDIWYLERTVEGWERKPYLVTRHAERIARFSPDGRWVAYLSNETGQYEVYVRRFPDGSGKRQVSIDGGTQLRWAGDEIFYVSDGAMMAVRIGLGEQLTIAAPVKLFESPNLHYHVPDANYDVSRDGQRFLVVEKPQDQQFSRFTIVQNWLKAYGLE